MSVTNYYITGADGSKTKITEAEARLIQAEARKNQTSKFGSPASPTQPGLYGVAGVIKTTPNFSLNGHAPRY